MMRFYKTCRKYLLLSLFVEYLLTFVQNAYFGLFGRDYLTYLPQSVISEDDTAVVVSTNTTLEQLVTTSELYKFYFQHPAAPLCEKHTECGFMLKVTPCIKYGKLVILIYNSSQRRVSIQLIFTVTVR